MPGTLYCTNPPRTAGRLIGLCTGLAMAGTLSACFTTPEYTADPLAELGTGAWAGTTDYQDLRLGLILSENARQSINHVREMHDMMAGMGLFANDTAVEDTRPSYSVDGLNSLLDSRFKDVVTVEDLEAVKTQELDLAMLLDLRIVLGTFSGETTSVDIGGIFLDPEGSVLSKVEARGEGVVPYPASILGFKPVAGGALIAFRNQLDGDKVLAEAVNALTGRGPALARAPARDDLPETPLAITFRSGATQPYDIAVIIGNADYSRFGHDIPDVVPAYADAAGFRQYAVQTLGVREGNIIDLRDATHAQMVRIFGSAKNPRGQLSDWVRPGRSRVYVYHSGHGAPGGADGSAYLVPSDADAARIELNGYQLETLYRNLSKLDTRSVTVVLEACFSDNSQAGSLTTRASPVFVMPRAATVPGNLTVITAGAADQIASWEEDMSHGLFTKYYLTAMTGAADAPPYGNGDGQVSYAELGRYLEDTVTYFARRYYGRDQESQVVIAD